MIICNRFIGYLMAVAHSAVRPHFEAGNRHEHPSSSFVRCHNNSWRRDWIPEMHSIARASAREREEMESCAINSVAFMCPVSNGHTFQETLFSPLPLPNQRVFIQHSKRVFSLHFRNRIPFSMKWNCNQKFRRNLDRQDGIWLCIWMWLRYGWSRRIPLFKVVQSSSFDWTSCHGKSKCRSF